MGWDFATCNMMLLLSFSLSDKRYSYGHYICCIEQSFENRLWCFASRSVLGSITENSRKKILYHALHSDTLFSPYIIIFDIGITRFTNQKVLFYCLGIMLYPWVDAWNVLKGGDRSACLCTCLYSMHISANTCSLELFPAVSCRGPKLHNTDTHTHSHSGSQSRIGGLFLLSMGAAGRGWEIETVRERNRESKKGTEGRER